MLNFPKKMLSMSFDFIISMQKIEQKKSFKNRNNL
jgi:hypothetical protein